jgi:hypothetical protein
MNPNPKPNSNFYLRYALFFIMGLLVAFGLDRTLHLTGRDDLPGWNQYECVGMPGNDRDGLRIGTDDDGDHGYINFLMDNYYTQYSPCSFPGAPADTAKHNNKKNTHNVESTFIKGGNISRCVLLAILQSLTDHDDYVNYAFGMEKDKTLLLIQGGHINPVTGAPMLEPLLFRTGNDLNCFCPNNCGIR